MLHQRSQKRRSKNGSASNALHGAVINFIVLIHELKKKVQPFIVVIIKNIKAETIFPLPIRGRGKMPAHFFIILLNQHCWLASLQYGALQPLIPLYIYCISTTQSRGR
ncbi:hypothetical protein HTS61_15000 [Escherichia coli]|nr:hypothetical protein [Escherichia coli]